jgi:hypothetical protein
MPEATQQAPDKVDLRARMLPPQRIQLAETWRQDWVVNAEVGTKIDEVLDPGYFALMCTQFQPFDRIEVRAESGEWVVELMVLRVERTWCRTHLLQAYKLSNDVADVAQAAPRHKVEHKGTMKKWTVIRISDGASVQDGFASKELAHQWLDTYERTIGPSASVQ